MDYLLAIGWFSLGFLCGGGIVMYALLPPYKNEPVRAEDLLCPTCGYYCLGKGGYGCIDKPGLVDIERRCK